MPIMRLHSRRAGAFAAALALAAIPLAVAQRSDSGLDPAITIVKSNSAETAAPARTRARALAADYRQFGRAKVGQPSEPQIFTFNFHHATTISEISESNDFSVSGGTCKQGHTYVAGDACSVEVTFTPQGPGHRTGVLKISHSASAQPMIVPTGGEGYGPAVAFIPSQIETVPTTIVNGTGLLLNAQGLAVDGGNNLYIADTGNNLIRYQDSSGVLSTAAGGGTTTGNVSLVPPTSVKLANPLSVVVDSWGNVWFSDSGNSIVRAFGPDWFEQIVTEVGGGPGSASCTYSSPCYPTADTFSPPYSLAFDPSDNLFANLNFNGDGAFEGRLAEDSNAIFDPGLFFLNPALEAYTSSFAMTVDGDDNIYYPYTLAGNSFESPACRIYGQNYAYSTGGSLQESYIWAVAGTENCGFSGDGGPATGAEIGNSIQGFAWDAAGNFYFTDTNNNRVRRIDGATGIIRTIGGSGTAAYSGDGGRATTAGVWAPTGIAVDSNGNVYTIATQKTETVSEVLDSVGVVRKFGAVGQVSFSTQLIGSPSTAVTIMVSNVGNDTLDFTHAGFTGGNSSDFAIDPISTSCNFTAPLNSGQNCLIGVIFTPGAAGLRSTTLELTDNTVSGSNLISVAGTGVTAANAQVSPTTLTFASQADGTSSASKPVTLSNTGGLTLTINSYTFTGTNPTEFSQTHTCGTTLAAGANCTINVTFSPTAAGSPSATLTVATTGGSPTVTLGGTSTAVVKAKVTLSAKTNPAKEGETVVLDSKVEGEAKALPTGKVELMEGATMLSEAKLDAGKATFKLSKLSAGTHMLTASYLGDKLHSPAESPTVKQVVK
jgi:sugar lactone lactonase YvrE